MELSDNEIAIIELRSVTLTIRVVGESYVLSGYGVAPYYDETYGSASAALGRAAILAACDAEGWVPEPADTEDTHTARWGAFIDTALD